MIVCGDFIDAQFGVMFGLTTMASAGSKKKIKLEQVRKTDHVWIYTVCIYIYLHISTNTYFGLRTNKR